MLPWWSSRSLARFCLGVICIPMFTNFTEHDPTATAPPHRGNQPEGFADAVHLDAGGGGAPDAGFHCPDFFSASSTSLGI